MPEPLLQVRELTVEFRSSPAPAVRQVNFDLAPGEAVGLLGESGSGKTTLARSLIRLLPPTSRIVSGSIRFRGTEILCAGERELQRIRGAQMALIFQEPELALNPVIPAGEQVAEVLRAHSSIDRRSCRAHVRSMLAAVGLPDADLYSAFPHQLSGGQRQRVVIAQALICKPSLLIADEPTSALDNVVQAEVLDLLRELRARFGLGLIFITHNPALLSRLADRVMVMLEGCIVEAGTFEQIYWHPRHPYTRALLKSIPPAPGEPRDGMRMPIHTIAEAP